MLRLYEFVVGYPQDCYNQFKRRLRSRIQYHPDLDLNACDFILAFVTITSRVGTDIEAAFKVIPEGKPVILVVFHHTFDPEYVVPDSKRFIGREDVQVFNMLFHETQDGLLRCLKNDEELKDISDWLIRMSPESESRPLNAANNGNDNRRWYGIAAGVFVGGAVLALVIWLIVTKTQA